MFTNTHVGQRQILITFLTLSLIFGLCSCSSGGISKNKLVGRWVCEEYPRESEHTRHSVDGYWYEFFSDGTYAEGHFTYAEHEQATIWAGSPHKAEDDFYTSWSGTYTVTEDGRLKITPQSRTAEIYDISLNGKKLTIDNRKTYTKIK